MPPLPAPAPFFFFGASATIASVVGGLLGYAIGYYAFETIGEWVVRTYGLQGALDSFRAEFEQYGTWIILIKGLTPIPYKLVTIASGFAAFNFPLFMLCALITRGARFFLIAALLKRYGAPIQEFIEKRLALVTWSFLAILIGGFAAVMYL